MKVLFRAIVILFVLLIAAAPGLADGDLLTLAYTANSSGEYAPCPT